MSKFEINRITIELIKAILRFRFSFRDGFMSTYTSKLKWAWQA